MPKLKLRGKVIKLPYTSLGYKLAKVLKANGAKTIKTKKRYRKMKY